MELDFSFPSLSKLALVNVGGLVVSQLFRRFFHNGLWRTNIVDFRNWDMVSRLINEAIATIDVLEFMKPKLFEIASEMWIHTFKSFLYSLRFMEPRRYAGFENVVWQNLHLKVTGELDLPKMYTEFLRSITEHKIHNLVSDFKLACELCLEEVALEIFQKLPYEEKQDIVKNANDSTSSLYWHDVVCNGSTDEQLCETLLNQAILLEDSYAVVYFWHKLDDVGKRNLSAECFKYAVCHQIPKLMCSTYQCLNARGGIEQLLATLKLKFLCCLLEWPYTEVFLSAFNELGQRLNSEQRNLLLRKVILKRCFCNYINFNSILKGIWHIYRFEGIDVVLDTDFNPIVPQLLCTDDSMVFTALIEQITLRKLQEVSGDDETFKYTLP